MWAYIRKVEQQVTQQGTQIQSVIVGQQQQQGVQLSIESKLDSLTNLMSRLAPAVVTAPTAPATEVAAPHQG